MCGRWGIAKPHLAVILFYSNFDMFNLIVTKTNSIPTKLKLPSSSKLYISPPKHTFPKLSHSAKLSHPAPPSHNHSEPVLDNDKFGPGNRPYWEIKEGRTLTRYPDLLRALSKVQGPGQRRLLFESHRRKMGRAV